MRTLVIIFVMGLFMSASFMGTRREKKIDVPQATMPVVCQTNAMQTLPAKEESLAVQSASFFTSLLDTKSWPPRWQCGTWSSFHGWLYITSDMIIWLSYFMIPLILAFFVYKKKTEPLPFRSIFFLFISFILACGLTHLVDAAIFWWPVYKLSALIRFGTATVSLGTVFALINIAPRVLELKSPETLERMVEERTAELHAVNIRLQEEITHRQAVEEKLLQLNRQLEEKSNRLARSNDELLKREDDLKKSDEQVRQLNTDLEQKVLYRTKELDAINKDLEAFSYSVSHDLRAPLRSIHGYASILSQDYSEKVDSESKKKLDVILKNSEYMGQLIDGLLNFARTSRTKMQKANFNANEQVRSIVDELQAQEEGRTVAVNIASLEHCQADITTLRQVWINLLSNAFKYTRKNAKPTIEIGSERNDHEVLYYVKDNGVGFDMAYSDKLFGVFQRLHRKQDFEGTGVGLALVKRIIDRHNGRVWAEAKVNEGAVFYFALPLE